MTDSKKTLAGKLATIANELGAIKKAGRNREQGYAFIEYAEIASRIRELLDKHQVIVYPEIHDMTCSEIRSAKGKLGYHYILNMRFLIVNGDDQNDQMERSWCGEATAYDDKGVNKAATAGTKYFLMRLFQISEKGDDPDSETPDEVAETSRPQTKKFGLDFKDVYKKIDEIESVDDLKEYWESLSLSDAQARALKKAFTKRKEELNGLDR